MSQDLPITIDGTPVRLLHRGLVLGVRIDGEFTALDWTRADLQSLLEQIESLLSPLRWHALHVARAAAEIWDVPGAHLFTSARYQAVCDARFAVVSVLREFQPSARDEQLAAIFGRCRTWIIQCVANAANLRETNIPFREKYDRLQAACKTHFGWPQAEDKEAVA